MSVERFTFKPRKLECVGCGQRSSPLLWNYDPNPPCVACGGELRTVEYEVQRAHTVIGDEIDRTIPDGVCYPDGTPRRFTSRQELKAAERASGYRVLERGERFRMDEASKARAQARGR